MASSELYKRHRPQVWEDMVGQRAVASLRNAVKKDQAAPDAEQKATASVYLFSGERGCGKTTAAFILAKALNCVNPPGDGNPCNICEVCQNIDSGTQLGVSYESMANKGSVDDVRAMVLRMGLNQPVTRQVFILDEVQNLSKTAQDALLIPLENESFQPVVIMCTTEPKRIQKALASRANARRFQLIGAEDMKGLLERISAQDNLDLSDGVMETAIRMGRGSARDTLTALDGLLSGGEDGAEIDFNTKLLRAFATLNAVEVAKVIAEANAQSIDMRELTEELYRDLMNVLLAANGTDRALLGAIMVEDPLVTARSLGGNSGMALILTELGTALTSMTMGVDERVTLELAAFKATATIRKALQAQKRGSE